MDIRRRSSMSVPNKSSSEVQGSYTINLNGQWLKSSTISNPNSTLYDGVYESFSNKGINSSGATMYIDISGYSTFTLYIRSYAESNYDYVMVSLLDKDITYNSSYSDTTLVKAHTRGNLQSGVNIDNYTKVEFTGIGSGNHRITIVYRKDSSLHSNNDRGYVLITKYNQTDIPEEPDEPENPADTSEYFTIESWEDGNNISFNKEILYAKNNGSWNTLSAGSTITLNNGDTAAFKRTIGSLSSSNYGQFTIPKLCEVRGNIMSLAFGDDFKNQTSLSGKNYCFYRLFYNCNIVNASLLLLPATTLVGSCYSCMFQGCTSLITAPELPATTLAVFCYENMFYDCKSLINAPELSAITLAGSCYKYMFYGCTSLTTAPELPAKTLTFYGYHSMFAKCTSLTSTPELPATILAEDCYSSMFFGCTSLTTAPEELPAITLPRSCYSSMFSDCTSLTSAPELPATTLAYMCYRYMFSGCTSLTSAPELSATTLAENCYGSMFKGCTSLTTAPEELPATILAELCYAYMFSNCINLITSPKLPAKTLVNRCYYGMFENTNVLPDCSNINFTNSSVVTSGGLAGLFYGTKVTDADLERILPKNSNGKYCLPVTTLYANCYAAMFSDCTLLVTAPRLPATKLANKCYEAMFSNCTSLINAPELPATTLADYCYRLMFTKCKSLVSAPKLPATTLRYACYSSMFNGCDSLVNAPELSATTLADNCYGSMFFNCTSLVTAPELPATELTSKCYYLMFGYCTKLNNITMLATSITDSQCLYNWVSFVASSGTFVKHPNMTSLPRGSSGIPSNWTVVNYSN